ncbi:acetoacetate--CoA ligase [Arthrobacter sp. GMC3]|uniref:acetoacetate--CoA ligase n=1 Tax=Arthrobacter sp. GMC3 TaxID=2058894 RepID=UPI000CE48C63|nr:acetoacetate--CoA ligase [Arthrobacter sp. GMC3]
MTGDPVGVKGPVHAQTILWEPTEAEKTTSKMAGFFDYVGSSRGTTLTDYRAGWHWSVESPNEFWDALREFFDVIGDGFGGPALAEDRMPGAVWYPQARLNFAENLLRHADGPFGDQAAIVDLNEDGFTREISWRELRSHVASLSAELRSLGIIAGDRVAAVLPNIPEAIIGLLATASIGATWCVCSPDLAPKAVLSRLQQLAPRILIGSYGYAFNGRFFDRRAHLAEVLSGLPSVEHTIVVSSGTVEGALSFDGLLRNSAEPQFARVPFDHPLWVLFTSGTTGTPKGIVHGHGGMTLEALKLCGLHFGLGPSDRYYVAANTSWMVWNTLLFNLMAGASVVTYAGSPLYPRIDRQFQILAQTRATMFGSGAAYLRLVQDAGLSPGLDHDLGALHTLMSTGSTLPDATALWIGSDIGARIHLGDSSGGTDICSAFIGPNPLQAVRLGRMQGPLLGVALAVFNEQGSPVLDEVGELVITAPMPAMPVAFWNDPSGARYHEAYFEHFDGVWTHGDWVLESADGSFEVQGRSDATLNRAGVRLGSAEIYSALQGLHGIRDSLVLGIELPDGGYYLPLFVVLDPGRELDELLEQQIIAVIREHASPRHVPDAVIPAPAIPVTHAGKKVEVPLKRLFAGGDPGKVDRGALANPDALDWFVDRATSFRSTLEASATTPKKGK